MSGSIYYPGISINSLGTITEPGTADWLLINHYDTTVLPPQYVPKRIAPGAVLAPTLTTGSGTTVGATALLVNNLPLAPLATCSYRVTGQVNGQSEITGDLVSFDFSALYKRIGSAGALNLVGSYNASQFYADASVSACTITTAGTSGNLPLISLNGVASLAVDWNWTFSVVLGT